MGALLITQIAFGATLGFGIWMATYAINRAWLGFWGFLR